MGYFKSIDEVLDFAIQNEQEAVDFYLELAATLKNEDMKLTFEKFAKEEVAHKARLIKVKTEERIAVSAYKNVRDLKISEYIVDVVPSPDMTYEDALVLAMKKEKAAYKLYLKLSETAPNDMLKKLFTFLANEEAKHKIRFEIEYDDNVLREN